MLAPGCRTKCTSTHPNAEELVTVPIPRQEHLPVNTDSFYTTSKQHKRRQHLCKVCSAFSDLKTKSFETCSYFRNVVTRLVGACRFAVERDAWRVATRRHAQRSGTRRGETTKTFQQAKEKD
ncbi:hypothetical protein GQ600_9967 [Phytophthora cactorum]|nr:hypothetical protein GQ600_9967 [Phytophthora cactorum]